MLEHFIFLCRLIKYKGKKDSINSLEHCEHNETFHLLLMYNVLGSVILKVSTLITFHRGRYREDVLDEREDRYLNGCMITTGCDLDRMSVGNRKVNITVTEYDLGDKLLSIEAVLLWQSCHIDLCSNIN